MKGYCTIEWLSHFEKIAYPRNLFTVLLMDNSDTPQFYNWLKAYEHSFSFELLVGHVKFAPQVHSRKRIADVRNILRDRCLQGNYQAFLSLEADIFMPPDGITKLEQSGKHVISGIYEVYYEGKTYPMILKHLQPSKTVMYKGQRRYFRQAYLKEEMQALRPDAVIQTQGAGLGCCLIHRNVLANLKFRYQEEIADHDDIFFSLDCLKAKIPFYAHTGVYCYHKQQDWGNIPR